MVINNKVEIQQLIKNLSGKTKFVISKNSRTMKISRQTYQNKLDDLRDQQIIKNFTININPFLNSINLKYVMIEIKTNPQEPELVEELLGIPQLRMLDGIIGDFSLFGLFIFRSAKEYYQILNKIDEIMAKSYFKKYQILETIKVFKTNGISLEEISLDLGKEIDLELIANNYSNVTYNPQKFPYIIMKIENPQATILINTKGKIIVTDFNNIIEFENMLDITLDNLKNIGIDFNRRKVLQNFIIDEIDYLILDILQKEQGLKPISTYEIKGNLSDKHHKFLSSLHKEEISQSTIHNRIKKLESHGVILNYTVNCRPKKIGFNGKYYLRIKPKNPLKYNELAFKLVKNKNITDLFRIGEQLGLFAIVRVKKVEDYADFIR
ncbi:MAG: hypothetical protein ACXABG_11820, partial [Promethearchaeota archaeon]